MNLREKLLEDIKKYEELKWVHNPFVHLHDVNATAELLKQSLLKNGVNLWFCGKDLHFDSPGADILKVPILPDVTRRIGTNRGAR